ncbi:MAG: response regulator transcription factor [Saprospiraceae bacterium]|nr:response regulator transcription factor [Saprospiraceae bacterium]
MLQEEVRILIVDDDPDILEFVGYNLRNVGYTVSIIKDRTRIIEQVAEFQPHLILLDIMMPEIDGVTVCTKIRRNKNFNETLIAFLTARHEEYSELAGLNAGADDYILKPVKPRILVSRVKALLRRHRHLGDESLHCINLGNLILDREKFMAMVDGNEISLPVKEFEILWLLASKPGKVYSRDSIYHNVWGSNVIVGNRTIDVHMSKIRSKLNQPLIETVKGVGYRLQA